MFELIFFISSGILFIVMSAYVYHGFNSIKWRIESMDRDIDILDRFKRRYLDGFYRDLEKSIYTRDTVDMHKNVQQDPKVIISLDDIKNTSFYEED